jgi:signal transduction histidine kinase
VVHRSLRWRFTLGFIVLQVVTIFASFALVLYIAAASSPGGAVPSAWLSKEVSGSVMVGGDGRPTIAPTKNLLGMIDDWPSLWFVIRFPDGSTFKQGAVPQDIADNIPFLSKFRSVELRGYIDAPDRQATVDKIETAAGSAIVLAGGVPMSLFQLTFVIGQFVIGVPALMLLVVTIVGVPWVTRWSLRSLDKLTDRLGRINFTARGSTVEERGLPNELLTVVGNINLVLQRLDAGFEQTERFFVNAAHELRTPVAVLQVRADTLPQSEDKLHILRGIKRLTAITNQLLDIERYRQNRPAPVKFELTGLTAKVVADLAPIAIAEGYEISFENQRSAFVIEGDPGAMERAISNLLRNAIQYGGKKGDISVLVEVDGTIKVTDQGVGISKELVHRIFEPFYRVNPHGAGAGLGLNMVSEIVEQHNGFIEVTSALGKGSTFAVKWRLPAGDRTRNRAFDS